MKLIIAIPSILSAGLLSTSFGATQLAIWTFGSSSANYTTDPTAEATASPSSLIVSGGELDDNGKNGVAYTDINGILHDEGQAAAWDDIKVKDAPNASAIIHLDTTGFADLSMRLDYRSQKVQFYDLAFSLDGGATWDQLLDNVPAFMANWDTGFDAYAVDLSGFDALEGQSRLQLRIDDLEEGPGNDKFAFDNLEITGSRIGGAVPEPGAALPMLLLLSGAILRRHRS